MTAIAIAPQNPTRSAGRTTPAPPSHAPSAPSTTRKISAEMETAAIVVPAGARTAASVGRTAPTENAAAEAKAARTGGGPVGRAELVAGVGGERVLRRQLLGDLAGERRLEAALLIDPGEFGQFLVWIFLERMARARGPPTRGRLAS